MDYPFVLIGDLGGKLKAGGRYINVARRHGHGDLYTSFLNAVGDNRKSFGSKNHSKGPLPALMK
jgi:hypothetical protein